MKLEDITAIVKLVENADVEEFEYTSNEGDSIFISKQKQQVLAAAPVAQPQQAVAPQPVATATPVAETSAPAVATSNDATNCIVSPIIGTFYCSNSPGASAFVSVGHMVNKGDVVCIIEAMKIMNQVRADKSGIIEEILVQDGGPVEYGQPLFVIKQ